MDKIGRDILNHMHQASMTFLWLLGPPDQVSGPSNARECPIKAQHSELEKFQPLVTQALPNSTSGKNSRYFHTQKGMKQTHKGMKNHCFSRKHVFHTLKRHFIPV
jgi:hypothetical protein